MILKNDSNAELARVIEELSARIDAIEGHPAGLEVRYENPMSRRDS